MNARDIQINMLRLRMVKSTIGDTKTCSVCKETLDGTYFTSLNGNGWVRNGYATCVLCRIKKNKYKLEPIFVEGKFIRCIGPLY